MTGLAEGTDRIAAKLALARGWQLVASLPFSRDAYVADFESEESKEEFAILCDKSCAVLTAPSADTYPDRNQGYAEQAKTIVAAAAALITVWDGQDAHGPGGTPEVIARAVAKGLPIFWIGTTPAAELRRL